jgi:predicted glycoside hydrolase/deacetylase ChbG (UPF0249 family)
MTTSITKALIVNADDFGLSAGVNRGIVQSHSHGIVTSASLMVRGTAAAEAAQLARQHPTLSIGLHLDLGEWEFQNGQWVLRYEVLANLESAEGVAAEVDRQLGEFRRLLGREPTHLDSHQHVHRNEPIRSALMQQGNTLGVPVRHFSPRIRYRGEFYGQSAKGDPCPQAISAENLLQLIAGLEPGITELGCHPGLGVDFRSVYLAERSLEVKALCDPRVSQTISRHGIQLISFAQV